MSIKYVKNRKNDHFFLSNNQMIWPIPTSKALFLGNIPSMHNVKITLQIIVTSKFRLNSLPLLA